MRPQYLYVLQFNNGHIKVGRSQSPETRITAHKSHAASFGFFLEKHFVIECFGSVNQAEKDLIAWCAQNAGSRCSREWFAGICFADAQNEATKLASVVLAADAKQANGLAADGCVDGVDRLNDRFFAGDLQRRAWALQYASRVAFAKSVQGIFELQFIDHSMFSSEERFGGLSEFEFALFLVMDYEEPIKNSELIIDAHESSGRDLHDVNDFVQGIVRSSVASAKRLLNHELALC